MSSFTQTRLRTLKVNATARMLSSTARDSNVPQAEPEKTTDSKEMTYEVPGYQEEDVADLLRSMEKTVVQSYADKEFVVNGIRFRGSIMAFPTFSVLWKAERWEDVTIDSLRILE